MYVHILFRIPLIETTRNPRLYAERPMLPNPGHAYGTTEKSTRSRTATAGFGRLQSSCVLARVLSPSWPCLPNACHARVHVCMREQLGNRPRTTRREKDLLDVLTTRGNSCIRRIVVLGRPGLEETYHSIPLRSTPDASGRSCCFNKLFSLRPNINMPDEVRATRRKGCRDCMHRRDGLAAGEAKDTQTRT